MYDDKLKVKKLKLVVNAPNEPYTARWEFPSAADTWCSSFVIPYEDIRHIVPPARWVGTNPRTAARQFIIPQVDQYWVVNVLPPLRVRVRVVAEIE